MPTGSDREGTGIRKPSRSNPDQALLLFLYLFLKTNPDDHQSFCDHPKESSIFSGEYQNVYSWSDSIPCSQGPGLRHVILFFYPKQMDLNISKPSHWSHYHLSYSESLRKTPPWRP